MKRRIESDSLGEWFRRVYGFALVWWFAYARSVSSILGWVTEATSTLDVESGCADKRSEKWVCFEGRP